MNFRPQSGSEGQMRGIKVYQDISRIRACKYSGYTMLLVNSEAVRWDQCRVAYQAVQERNVSRQLPLSISVKYPSIQDNDYGFSSLNRALTPTCIPAFRVWTLVCLPASPNRSIALSSLPLA